jgi:hypothetical protein
MIKMPDYNPQKGYDGLFRCIGRAVKSISEGAENLENALDAGKKRWQENAEHARENMGKIKENWKNLVEGLKKQISGED